MRKFGVALLGLSLFWSGCGNSDTYYAATNTPPTQGEAIAPDLQGVDPDLAAPGGAGPSKSTFTFDIVGRTPLTSTTARVDQIVLAPNTTLPTRFAVNLSDTSVQGLLDRRLVIQIGDLRGPVIQEGVEYPLGLGNTRVNYIERFSATQLQIFESTAGTIVLEDVAPGHAVVRVAATLSLRNNPQVTVQVRGTGYFDF